MDFREYAEQAAKTAFYPHRGNWVSYPIMGLIGEAGEVANVFKKYMRWDYDRHDLKERMIEELGDVLWYVAAIAYEMRIDLDEVASKNIEKLAERHKEKINEKN